MMVFHVQVAADMPTFLDPEPVGKVSSVALWSSPVNAVPLHGA